MPDIITVPAATPPAATPAAAPQNLLDAANLTPPATPPAATPPTDPAVDPATPPANTPPAAYHPDTLPEDMRGATDKDTIDKLMGARPQAAPETADDYQFELTGAAKDLIENPDEDGGLKVFRDVAHKNGLSQDQANTIFNDFFGQAVDAGMVQNPVDYQAELMSLAPAGESDPEKAQAAAGARIQKSMDVLDGLKTRKVLGEEDYNFAMGFFDSAQGVQVFEKMIGQMQPEGLSPGGENINGGSMTKEKLDAMQVDPRYSSQSDKYDPSYRVNVDKIGEQFYATQS